MTNKKKRTRTKKKQTRTKSSPSTKQERIELQNIWYKKLKDSGFHDIELFNKGKNNPYQGEPTQYLRGYSLAQFGHMHGWEKSYQHYHRIRNYITHNPKWSSDNLERVVADMYADGISYRKIVKELKRRGFQSRTNVWQVHKVVHRVIPLAYAWNKKHHLGLDYESF